MLTLYNRQRSYISVVSLNNMRRVQNGLMFLSLVASCEAKFKMLVSQLFVFSFLPIKTSWNDIIHQAQALVSASSWSNSCCSLTIPQRPQCGIDWATCPPLFVPHKTVLHGSPPPRYYPAPSSLCCCFNTSTVDWPSLVFHSCAWRIDRVLQHENDDR